MAFLILLLLTAYIIIRASHVMSKFSGVAYWLIKREETHLDELHLCSCTSSLNTFIPFFKYIECKDV